MRVGGVLALLAGSIALVAVGVAPVACNALSGVNDLGSCEGCDGLDGGDEAGGDGSTSDGSDQPTNDFATIGGAVSKLVGKGLLLKNNGVDDLPIAQNGNFTFETAVKRGDPYAVTVASQPTDPSQLCAVDKGSGTVSGTPNVTNVTDVAVTCSTVTYNVGGLVVGTIGAGGALTNNGVDDLPISGPAPFTFATKVPSGSPFAVAMKTQPESGGPCDVSGASGTVGVADVTSVVVNCTPGTFTVGGTVTGLTGTVIVQNNNGNDTKLTANGTFAFSTPLAPNAAYAVTVLTQPAYPPKSQTCTVTNGSGVMASANVTNVAIACVTNTFAVGGSVTDLTTGTLLLKNNGGDNLSTTISGPFTFSKRIASGDTYNVTATPPNGQACAVTKSAGSVTNGDVTNVGVQCSLDPGIKCGATTYCKVPGQICCLGGSPTCAASGGACSGESLACDSSTDCGATGVCCASYNKQGNFRGANCQSSATACAQSVGPNDSVEIWCDPIVKPSPRCPVNQTCIGTAGVGGYKKCQ